MKKTLSLLLTATILTLGTTVAQATEAKTQEKTAETAIQQSEKPPVHCHSKEEMRKNFEQRLNLTEKQKEKAKAIHEQGREKMKPVMEQIRSKYQEIEAVKLSRMSGRMQQEKISKLEAEIAELKKEAHKIRKENSKDFERILNKKQKAELEKMKAEGRARFEKHHPPRPPFAEIGTPNLFPQKQILPPAHQEPGPWVK